MPASAPRKRATAATATCSRKAPPASRSRSTCPRRWAWIPTIRWPRRSGTGRRGDFLAGRHGAAFDGIPLQDVSTSMTINSTAAILLAFYALVARAAGRGPAQTLRHDPERHPEGVHRARHVHLSAAAGDAHHHRHLRLGRPRDARVEHHLDQRLSHPRSGLHRGAGTGVHVRQRDRVYRGGDRGRACGRFVCAAALVLLQLAQRFSGGDREIPRGAAHLRPADARPLRRAGPALARCCASTCRRPGRR